MSIKNNYNKNNFNWPTSSIQACLLMNNFMCGQPFYVKLKTCSLFILLHLATDEVSILLGCGATSLGDWWPTFRDMVITSPEDAITALSWNYQMSPINQWRSTTSQKIQDLNCTSAKGWNLASTISLIIHHTCHKFLPSL